MRFSVYKASLIYCSVFPLNSATAGTFVIYKISLINIAVRPCIYAPAVKSAVLKVACVGSACYKNIHTLTGTLAVLPVALVGSTVIPSDFALSVRNTVLYFTRICAACVPYRYHTGSRDCQFRRSIGIGILYVCMLFIRSAISEYICAEELFIKERHIGIQSHVHILYSAVAHLDIVRQPDLFNVDYKPVVYFVSGVFEFIHAVIRIEVILRHHGYKTFAALELVRYSPCPFRAGIYAVVIPYTKALILQFCDKGQHNALVLMRIADEYVFFTAVICRMYI